MKQHQHFLPSWSLNKNSITTVPDLERSQQQRQLVRSHSWTWLGDAGTSSDQEHKSDCSTTSTLLSLIPFPSSSPLLSTASKIPEQLTRSGNNPAGHIPGNFPETGFPYQPSSLDIYSCNSLSGSSGGLSTHGEELLGLELGKLPVDFPGHAPCRRGLRRTITKVPWKSLSDNVNDYHRRSPQNKRPNNKSSYDRNVSTLTNNNPQLTTANLLSQESYRAIETRRETLTGTPSLPSSNSKLSVTARSTSEVPFGTHHQGGRMKEEQTILSTTTICQGRKTERIKTYQKKLRRKKRSQQRRGSGYWSGTVSSFKDYCRSLPRFLTMFFAICSFLLMPIQAKSKSHLFNFPLC